MSMCHILLKTHVAELEVTKCRRRFDMQENVPVVWRFSCRVLNPTGKKN